MIARLVRYRIPTSFACKAFSPYFMRFFPQGRSKRQHPCGFSATACARRCHNRRVSRPQDRPPRCSGLSCPICNLRKEKRFCLAVHDRICPQCCGEQREVTLECPSECSYLQQARQHEKPRDFPENPPEEMFPAIRLEGRSFVRAARASDRRNPCNFGQSSHGPIVS